MNSKEFESIYKECNTAAESACLESPLDATSKPPMLFEDIYFECNLKPLFEQVLREMNGQAISANAMTDYKRNNMSFDKICDEIEKRLEQQPIPLQTYILKDNESFTEDYNNIYLNKIFNTPIGVKAKIGDNQADKFIKRGRQSLLYATKEVIENPTVIIWDPPNQNALQTAHQEKRKALDTLIFAKSFIMKQKRLQVINSVTIDRANMRVIINTFERSVQDFMNKKVRKKQYKSCIYKKIESSY
ncbi:MAG: hypothetical protein LBK73_05465 [Treponema sp.]|jgi:hypothetical protein|nr:hypothetical protein [Treponema sp.]